MAAHIMPAPMCFHNRKWYAGERGILAAPPGMKTQIGVGNRVEFIIADTVEERIYRAIPFIAYLQAGVAGEGHRPEAVKSSRGNAHRLRNICSIATKAGAEKVTERTDHTWF